MTKEQGREEGGPVVSAPFAPHWRRWRSIAAAGAVGGVGTLALVALHHPATEDSRYAAVEQEAPASVQAADPLRAELSRCRALPAQSDDLACRAAWDESRRRFFGEVHAIPVPSTPIESESPAVPLTQAAER